MHGHAGGVVIYVIASIELHPGTRRQFLDEFARLVPEGRAERGCIEYAGATGLDTGIGAQAPVRPDVVTVVEKWAGLESLVAHLSAPHMEAYRQRVKDFVIRTTLQVLAPEEDDGREFS